MTIQRNNEITVRLLEQPTIDDQMEPNKWSSTVANESFVNSPPHPVAAVSKLKNRSVTLFETYCRAALRSIGEKKRRPGQPARNAQRACRAILSPIRSLRSRETAFNTKTEGNEKEKKEKREKKIAGGFFSAARDSEAGKRSVGSSTRCNRYPELARSFLISLLASSAEYL